MTSLFYDERWSILEVLEAVLNDKVTIDTVDRSSLYGIEIFSLDGKLKISPARGHYRRIKGLLRNEKIERNEHT